MSDKPTKIFFVTWPDGKIVEGSQTSVSEDMAIGRVLRTWLIPQFFPDLDLGARFFGPMEALWRSMQKAGFKVQAVSTDAVGLSY